MILVYRKISGKLMSRKRSYVGCDGSGIGRVLRSVIGRPYDFDLETIRSKMMTKMYLYDQSYGRPKHPTYDLFLDIDIQGINHTENT